MHHQLLLKQVALRSLPCRLRSLDLNLFLGALMTCMSDRNLLRMLEYQSSLCAKHEVKRG